MHSRNLRIFLLKNIQVFFECLDSHIKEKTKTLKKNHIVQAHSLSNRQVSKKYRKNIRSLHFQQRDPRQCSKSGFPLHHLLSRPLLSSLGRGEKQVNGSSDSGSFFPPSHKRATTTKGWKWETPFLFQNCNWYMLVQHKHRLHLVRTPSHTWLPFVDDNFSNLRNKTQNPASLSKTQCSSQSHP